MDDEERISCINVISPFDNNDKYSELDEEVEQLVITEEMEDVEHNMNKVPVVKKCFNGLHHESTKKIRGRVKRSVKPIPGVDMTYCHFTKEQNKEICVDSKTGDLIRVENVPVEHQEEIHHNEDYTDFFNTNVDGDGIIRNNKVTTKNVLKLQVGIKIKTEYGVATVTKIREDSIVEAQAAGIMKIYVPLEKVQIYLNRNACDKILEFAIANDKEHYTKNINRTTMNVIQHTYKIKMQTDKGANCSVTSNKSICININALRHIV